MLFWSYNVMVLLWRCNVMLFWSYNVMVLFLRCNVVVVLWSIIVIIYLFIFFLLWCFDPFLLLLSSGTHLLLFLWCLLCFSTNGPLHYGVIYVLYAFLFFLLFWFGLDIFVFEVVLAFLCIIWCSSNGDVFYYFFSKLF